MLFLDEIEFHVLQIVKSYIFLLLCGLHANSRPCTNFDGWFCTTLFEFRWNWIAPVRVRRQLEGIQLLPQFWGGSDPPLLRQPAAGGLGSILVQVHQGIPLLRVSRVRWPGAVLRVMFVGLVRLRQGRRLRVFVHGDCSIRARMQRNGNPHQMEVDWNVRWVVWTV